MCFSFAHGHCLLRPRVFSRALGSGAPREATRPPGRKCGWTLDEVRGKFSGGFKPQNMANNYRAEFRARRAIQARHSNPRAGSQNIRRVAKSFITLLTARAGCLPTSRSCSSPRARARVHSCPCTSGRDRARVLMFVLDCVSWLC